MDVAFYSKFCCRYTGSQTLLFIKSHKSPCGRLCDNGGYDLSLVSLMGVIALSGVVVNDSLIMIDHANKHRGDLSAYDAIYEAGIRRFRPIILTTITTFGGLTPIILETSSQAYQLIPMAISLISGSYLQQPLF